METYSLLREFADSWMLLFLTLVFVGIVGWAFRPGSRPLHDDAAASIFRHDKTPGAEIPGPHETALEATSKEARK